MSTEREELAELIHAWTCGCGIIHTHDYYIADAIIYAGWTPPPPKPQTTTTNFNQPPPF